MAGLTVGSKKIKDALMAASGPFEGSKQYTGIDPAKAKDKKTKQPGPRGAAGRPLGAIRTPLSTR